MKSGSVSFLSGQLQRKTIFPEQAGYHTCSTQAEEDVVHGTEYIQCAPDPLEKAISFRNPTVDKESTIGADINKEKRKHAPAYIFFVKTGLIMDVDLCHGPKCRE